MGEDVPVILGVGVALWAAVLAATLLFILRSHLSVFAKALLVFVVFGAGVILRGMNYLPQYLGSGSLTQGIAIYPIPVSGWVAPSLALVISLLWQGISRMRDRKIDRT